MTTELIRGYYEAFNRRDYESMLAVLAPEAAHDINQGPREIGKERFRAFLARMDQAYREQLSDLVVMADETGRRFAAEFMVDGTYLQADPGFPPAHGQRYRVPAGAFFEVHGGFIQRVSTYYNLEDWLRQVRAS